MIYPAVADLVGSTVESWYSRCSAWTVIGWPAGWACVDCDSSRVQVVLSLGDWPHDLVHPLTSALDRVVLAVAESLREEDRDGIDHSVWTLGHDHDGAAASIVRMVAADYRPAILEVLEQCVAPKLDQWAALVVDECLRRLTQATPEPSGA